MKKPGLMILIAGLLGIILAAGYEKAEIVKYVSNDSQLKVGVKLPKTEFEDIKMSDSKMYNSLKLSTGGYLEVGKPSVMGLSSWIGIPEGAQVSISVDKGVPVVYKNVSLPPLQAPQPEIRMSQKPPFDMDQVVYRTNAAYPGKLADIEKPKKMSGMNATLLWVYPYQYNPVKKTLYVYRDLKVTVSFNQIQARSLSTKTTERKSGGSTGFFKSLTINPEVVSTESAITDSKTRSSADSFDYLIITHENFVGAANRLADWKNSNGIKTRVASTKNIGTSSDAIDNYIESVYASCNPAPAYLLLFGDAEFIPPHYVHDHPYPYPAEDLGKNIYQGKIGTDIYYADIHDDTNDPVEEFFYGRIPVDNAEQANKAVERIIAYERGQMPQNLYNTATMAGYFQDNRGYAERRFLKTCEDVRDYMITKDYSVERVYYTPPSAYPAYWTQDSRYVFENDISGGRIPEELTRSHFAWDGDAVDVKNAVNKGTFLLLHRDHGSRTLWNDPYFTADDVDNLKNGSLQPLVFSINCQTGWFDNETDLSKCNTGANEESFIEHWIRNQNGGSIGLIASTRVSYSGHNDRLAWGFMDAIYPDFIESKGGSFGGPNQKPILFAGEIVSHARAYLRTQYSNDYTRLIEIEMFHWFGDPTMRIHTRRKIDMSPINMLLLD